MKSKLVVVLLFIIACTSATPNSEESLTQNIQEEVTTTTSTFIDEPDVYVMLLWHQHQHQWNNLKSTIEEAGAEVKVVPPVEAYPDLVFTANSGIIRWRKNAWFWSSTS